MLTLPLPHRMNTQVHRLFPMPGAFSDLAGLYLGLEIYKCGSTKNPFVYANFLTSLDGRIALENETGEAYLPRHLTTTSDFRLFLELQCQADCLITHGGYLRSLHAGRLGNILQVGVHPLGAELAAWRLSVGLSPQPAVVIVSASLDFPMHPSLTESGQRCLIATGSRADPSKIAYWEAQGFEVFSAGRDLMVEAGLLVSEISARGYVRPYLIAGPDLLDSMVRERKISSIFQTISHQLLGGESFRTMVPGPMMGDLGHLKMETLYYDEGHGSVGQWFAQFTPVNVSTRGENDFVVF